MWRMRSVTANFLLRWLDACALIDFQLLQMQRAHPGMQCLTQLVARAELVPGQRPLHADPQHAVPHGRRGHGADQPPGRGRARQVRAAARRARAPGRRRQGLPVRGDPGQQATSGSGFRVTHVVVSEHGKACTCLGSCCKHESARSRGWLSSSTGDGAERARRRAGACTSARMMRAWWAWS